jgi:hypothetical protein
VTKSSAGVEAATDEKFRLVASMATVMAAQTSKSTAKLSFGTVVERVGWKWFLQLADGTAFRGHL